MTSGVVEQFTSNPTLLGGLAAATQLANAAPPMKSESSLIRGLRNALNTLAEALRSGEPAKIDAAVVPVKERLDSILKERDNYPKHFKNYSSVRTWDHYLTPLTSLKREIDHFLSPSFDRSPERIEQALTPAVQLVEAEVAKQTGYVAGAVESGFDMLVTKVTELTSKGESSSSQNQTYLPPLYKFQKVLAHYFTYSADTIPAVMEEELKLALHELDSSSPLLKGVEERVLNRLEGRPLTATNVEREVTQFIFEHLSMKNATACQFIYLVAHENNAVPARRVTDDQAAQVQWGKDFLEDIQDSLLEEGILRKDAQILWSAFTQWDEVMSLSVAMEQLQAQSSDSLQSLSAKVDQALAYFETNPYINQAVMRELSTTINDWLGIIFETAKPSLNREERIYLGRLLTQVKRFINQEKHVEALKLLKQGFERPSLANQMDTPDSRHQPLTTISQMVNSFDRQSKVSQSAPPKAWDVEINQQRDELIENLTFFSTYKVMESLCPGITPDEGEQIFARLHKGIEGLEGEKKDKRFVDLLKAEIQNRPDKGFFGKLYAKLVVSFVFDAVKFFSIHFTESLMERLKLVMHRPHENPLGTDHLAPIQGINNALVAFLQAENRFQNDPEGREAGGIGKRLRMKHFLEDPSLNGGFESKELINKVVRRAIQDFIHLRELKRTSTNWNEKLVDVRTNSGALGAIVKYPLTYLAQGLLFAAKPLFWACDRIHSGVMKLGSSYLISKMDIINTVLESTNRALYDDAQYTSSMDGFILDQLRELEKLLEQEGGELSLYEGDNGKRLFQEVVDNLFAVLDKRGQLTPQQKEKRDNLLAHVAEGLEDLADAKLKETVRDILIFAYQTMRTEDRMNETMVQILKKTNETLRPPRHPIYELYSEADIAKISMELGGDEPTEHDLLTYFALFDSGKVPKSELEQARAIIFQMKGSIAERGDLVKYYRGMPSLLSRDVTRKDLDEALKRKFQKAEDEIRIILDRILKKSVEDVVVSQAATLLQSPEQALVNHLDWIENQFVQERGEATSYMKEMRKHIDALERGEASHINELLQDHLKMMRTMKKNLKQITEKEGVNTVLDHRIQVGYQISEMLFPLLQRTSEMVIEYQATKDPKLLLSIRNTLDYIEQRVRAKEGTIRGMRYALQREDGSTEKTVRKWKDWVLDVATQPAVEHITKYVHHRLNKRAQEGVFLYKDPNTLPHMIRHVVCLPYLNKQDGKRPMGTRQLFVGNPPPRVHFSTPTVECAVQ